MICANINHTKILHSDMPEIIKTDKAAKPLGAYPHARRVGNLLFLSGIGSRNSNDNSIPWLSSRISGYALLLKLPTY